MSTANRNHPIDDAASLRERIAGAFAAELAAVPKMSLRAADAIDGYSAETPPYSDLDHATDSYLEQYAFSALPFLDAESWRSYLPRLLDYAVRHVDSYMMAVDGLLFSLRPPDRDPPRLASLTPAQEAVVTAVLEFLAFSDDSVYQAGAAQVLEEWWIDKPLYRHNQSRP